MKNLKKTEPKSQIRGFEMVDLGLSVKWATCNVGATNETEGGKYFMWGETVGRTADEVASKPCNWETAPWGEDTPSVKTLDKEHDAATVAYGDGYRMPTEEELLELKANTTVEWVTNYKGSGVNGRTFTASNGNSIFIPAVGYCRGSSVSHVGSYCGVWSSIPLSSYNAYVFSFDRYYIIPQGFIHRCGGYPIRAVCSVSK